MNCPLCLHHAEFYFSDERLKRQYFHCQQCDLRFLDPANYLRPDAERERYELHNNDMENEKYRNYMQPIAEWVTKNCEGRDGLDFGCGKAPLLAKILTDNGFNMRIYDPYFFTDLAYRDCKFDFTVAVEAAEHFYSPKNEFEHLVSMLKPSGGIGIVTLLYREELDFKSWYYRLDPSHVCFYSEQTFLWLKQHFGFQRYTTNGTRFNWLAF